MYRRSDIKFEAQNAIASYEKTFPSAYAFLGAIAADKIDGFWFSTKINAHLYYLDAYFAYIKFYPLELEFIAKYNWHIASGTRDRSSYLFGETLKDLARKHDLITSRLVSFQGHEKMFVKRDTPLIFFEDFLDLVKESYERIPKG